VYSNKVTTVSPTYAADVLTEQFGYDMHVALNTHKYVQFQIFIVRTGEI
jgi:glycogen synthase